MNVLKIVLSLLFIFSADVYAAELIIIDSSGLTRARKNIKTTAVVEVEVEVEVDGDLRPVLKNTDGLSSEIQSSSRGGIHIFKAVSAGTWRLSLSGAGSGVSMVRIVQ